MRTLLLAILGVTLALPAYAQGVNTIQLPCYPTRFVEDAMITQGFTDRMTGAFDDGDLLIIYRNKDGRFMAGFANPNGGTCILGPGDGLQTREMAPKGEKS